MANDIPNNAPGALTQEAVSGFRETFDADPSKRMAQNVVTQHDVNDMALITQSLPIRLIPSPSCWTTGV